MLAASGSGGDAGVAIAIVVLFALYMAPTVIGAVRKVVNVGSVFAVNLFLGWTLIGWAVALAMALRTNPPHAYGQYWGRESAPPPAPQVAAPGWYVDQSGVTRWWDGAQWTTQTPGEPPKLEP